MEARREKERQAREARTGSETVRQRNTAVVVSRRDTVRNLKLEVALQLGLLQRPGCRGNAGAEERQFCAGFGAQE